MAPTRRWDRRMRRQQCRGSGTVGDSIRNAPANSAPPSASAPQARSSDDSSDDSISVTGGVPGAPRGCAVGHDAGATCGAAPAPAEAPPAAPAVAAAPAPRRRLPMPRALRPASPIEPLPARLPRRRRSRTCAPAPLQRAPRDRADVHRRRRRACGRAVHGNRADRAAAFGTGSRGARSRERTSACCRRRHLRPTYP